MATDFCGKTLRSTLVLHTQLGAAMVQVDLPVPGSGFQMWSGSQQHILNRACTVEPNPKAASYIQQFQTPADLLVGQDQVTHASPMIQHIRVRVSLLLQGGEKGLSQHMDL